MSCRYDAVVGAVGHKVGLNFIDCYGNPIDLTSATIRIAFQKPGQGPTYVVGELADFSDVDGSTITPDAQNGRAMYVTTDPTFLDIRGVWEIAGEATIGTDIFPSEIVQFNVGPSLF